MIVPSLAHLPLASITRFSWAGDAFGKWKTHDAIPFRSCNKKAAGQFFLQKKQLTSGLEVQTTYFEKGTRMTTQAHFSKLDQNFPMLSLYVRM